MIRIAAPSCSLSVIAVPGHTLSHVAYLGAGHLFCGDTLFSLGCGRLFEGTPAQMLASLDRLSELSADTLVCGGHEYTQANARFATTVEPHNRQLATRQRQVAELREKAAPTLPVELSNELACNPFLRVEAEEVIAWCRTQGVDGRSGRPLRRGALGQGCVPRMTRRIRLVPLALSAALAACSTLPAGKAAHLRRNCGDSPDRRCPPGKRRYLSRSRPKTCSCDRYGLGSAARQLPDGRL